eukprot:c23711_g1_i1 orf=95-940(+)
MGSFTRVTRYIKDFWKVVVRGENDDLQRQTLSMQEELARLRNRRMASDKEREAAALNQARGAVQKLRDLHNSLLAAEAAASEFAAKVGEAARSNIEAHAETREQTCKKFFAKQKQLYEQEIKPELQGDTGVPVSELLSQLNEQNEPCRSPELKMSGPADDKNAHFAAMGGNMSNEAGRSEICSPAVEGGAEKGGEDVRQPLVSPVQEDVASSFSSSNNAEVHEIMEIPPNVLAQMIEEARKQVRLEEKSHVEALSREKEILEKEIKARENAECASVKQSHQ